MVLVFLFLGGSLANAQVPREVQEKMRERLPRVDALKKEQLVGENRRGFLAILQPLDESQEKIVRAENADRKKIYAFFAAKSGATVRQVGAIRARQIAADSAPGVMIEDEDGAWMEKK